MYSRLVRPSRKSKTNPVNYRFKILRTHLTYFNWIFGQSLVQRQRKFNDVNDFLHLQSIRVSFFLFETFEPWTHPAVLHLCSRAPNQSIGCALIGIPSSSLISSRLRYEYECFYCHRDCGYDEPQYEKTPLCSSMSSVFGLCHVAHSIVCECALFPHFRQLNFNSHSINVNGCGDDAFDCKRAAMELHIVIRTLHVSQFLTFLGVFRLTAAKSEIEINLTLIRINLNLLACYNGIQWLWVCVAGWICIRHSRRRRRRITTFWYRDSAHQFVGRVKCRCRMSVDDNHVDGLA